MDLGFGIGWSELKLGRARSGRALRAIGRLAPYLTAALLLAAVVFSFGYTTGVRHEDLVQRGAAGERADTERQILDLVVRRNPAATIRDFADFPAHLIAEAEKHRIDFRLVLALIDHESEFNPRAVGSRGEVGLMQVLPDTADQVCLNLKMDCVIMHRARPGAADLGSLGDPKLNVTIGLTHLAGLRDEFRGMGAVALRAYNRGSSRAREPWPRDQYAERVAMKFVRVAHEVRP